MIPTVEDLRSSPLVHRFGDVFNPPGLTNFLGTVQVDVDPVAIRSLTFPPFSCGDVVTGSLSVNGKIFPAWGAAVTVTWLPDRIERVAEIDGLRLSSTTVMVVGSQAAIVRLRVENVRTGGAERPVQLKLGLRGGATKSVSVWSSPAAPVETDNELAVDAGRRALRSTAKNSAAVWLQGTSPPPDEITSGGAIFSYRFNLRPGETRQISYTSVVAETRGEAERTYDAITGRADAETDRARDDWNRELAAVFTPGNDRYSGFMPTLQTSDRDILKLYWTGILGVIYFKRDTPHSVHGRAYATLMPRYWHTTTFLWDYALSSLVHALLDPSVMRAYLARWMHLDIHKHFGTEFLTGGGVGPWYAVNDFAMTTIARDYLRFTGDHAFLDEKVEDRRVVDYLASYATAYKQFQTPSGLADYGGLNNLLECVNSYLHEVASLNAANVFNLRAAADVAALRGNREAAEVLRDQALALVGEVQKLYAAGKGYWCARFPDGSLREVRHVYDLLTVLNVMCDDLSEKQKREMTGFFVRELRTPAWMHALSCDDDDATFSVRPDHQWTGAYPAWPPLTVTGLYKIGQSDLAFEWLKGLARSANQGPFGQAHFAESVVEPDAGGARKAPPDPPYITDWTCSSNGAWCNVIIESLFGVKAPLAGGVSATPQFGRFDPDARLTNLRYQGHRYDVTRKGIRAAT